MKTRNTVSIVLAGVTLLCLAGVAPVTAGPRDHADGFFLRLSSGFGSTKSTLESGENKAEFSKAGTDINIAIGGVVAPNLALHGTLFGWVASNPDLTVNGVDLGSASGDLTVAGAGIGLTWYFMPSNFYLSTSVGAGSLEFDAGNLSGETDTGPMIDLTLGKEWWVGDKWGLGVAAGMIYHSFNDPDVDEPWSGTSFTVRFSATMN